MAVSYSIALIPGDGIGPDVVAEATRVLTAAATDNGVTFDFATHRAGHGVFLETGESMSEEVLSAARDADSVLVGAMDVAQIPSEAVQPLRALRRHLEVGASVRPARGYAGVPCVNDGIDTVVVREVTEGVNSGIEYMAGADAACGVRLITRAASERVARIAFEQAMGRRKLVTAVHKVGALQVTDGFFLKAVAGIAEQYPDVEYETRNVDACALELIRHPEDFDVVLATNMFGDILSDVAIGVAAGLGLAASGCIGERWAYFEPVHGTAPDIAGQGVANPLAAILSAAMMARHLGESRLAARMEDAVEKVLSDGDALSRDLGGSASTEEVGDAVIGALS